MNFTDPSAARAALIGVLVLALAACGSPGPRKPAVRSGAPPAASGIDPSTALAATDANLSKGDPEQRFQEALALMKARRLAEAQAAFITLSRDYPGFSGPLTDLGILYARTGQPEQAMASLRRAVAANPDNAVAHNWLGTLYREAGDFAQAEQAYRRAIAARPGYAPAQLNLAILYELSLRRPDQALAAYREYQRLTGKDDLIVVAWIRDLESRMQAPPAPLVRTATAEGRLP